MRREFVNVLYERVKGYCDVRFGTSIASLDRDEQSVRLRFDDGAIADAEFLVGADGLHSLVRRLAFGAELRCRQFLGDYAVAFVIDDVPPPLRRSRAAVTLAVPGRQVTVYPIRGGRMATLFLHRAQCTVEDFSPAAACRELHSSTVIWDGSSPSFSTAASRHPLSTLAPSSKSDFPGGAQGGWCWWASPATASPRFPGREHRSL